MKRNTHYESIFCGESLNLITSTIHFQWTWFFLSVDGQRDRSLTEMNPKMTLHFGSDGVSITDKYKEMTSL